MHQITTFLSMSAIVASIVLSGCSFSEVEHAEADLESEPITGLYTDGVTEQGDALSELTLSEGGTFRLTVDQSERCGSNPTCVHVGSVSGTFTVHGETLKLAAARARGVEPTVYTGTYHYATANGSLTMRRDDWKGWSATLRRVRKGRSVSLADVSTLSVKANGGYEMGGPEGSSCKNSDRSYILERATGDLRYKKCRASTPGGATHLVAFAKRLPAQDVQRIVDLAARMELTDSGCTEDAPDQWLSMKHGDVVEYYRTSTQACQPDAYSFVSGMGPVVEAFDALTR